MADAMIGDLDTNFTDKRATQGNSAAVLTNPAEFQSVSTMKTRLAAFNGTSYTAARMNTMTVNDLVYALRLADEAGSI